MRRITLSLIVAMTVAGAPALPAPAQSNAKADPNQIVCKKQPKIGTRFADKICHTRAEWEQITEENKRAAAEMANRALNRRCTPSGQYEC